jgi:hypothetical protein
VDDTQASLDPRVSVVMAAHNAAEFVGESIASVLAQTLTDFELVIVDDGSTDDTADIVRSFADPRVRLVSVAHKAGAAAARNLGMRSARAGLIAILDADDIAYPERLARQVAYLDDHPECCVLGTSFDRIDASGTLLTTVASPCDTTVIRYRLLTSNVIAHSSVMLRRDDALAAGGYPEQFRNSQDYALWAAMAPLSAVAQLPEALIAYRQNPGGLSATRTSHDRRATIETAQTALSAAIGQPVSWDAAACLCGMPPDTGRLREPCLEAARALAVALQTMCDDRATSDLVAKTLVSDWRRQVTRLCAIAPTALPGLVALSPTVTATRGGARDTRAAHLAWVAGCGRTAARSVARRLAIAVGLRAVVRRARRSAHVA